MEDKIDMPLSKEGEKLLQQPDSSIQSTQKKPSKYPAGIKFLIITYSISIIFYILFVVFTSKDGFFGKNYLVNLISMIIAGIFIYGFIKISKPIWNFMIIISIASLIYLLISLILNYNSPQFNVMGIDLSSILIKIYVITFILSALELWYLYKKKSFFETKIDTSSRIEDKILIFGSILISVIVVIVIFASFMQLVPKVAANVKEMEENVQTFPPILANKSLEEGILFCEEKDSLNKDLCYSILAPLNFNNTQYPKGELCLRISNLEIQSNCYIPVAMSMHNLKICEKIADLDYKNWCIAMVNVDVKGCNAIKNQKIKDKCTSFLTPI